MGGFQQRPWTPTKRRGPIAAEFSGPGPAFVALTPLVGTTPVISQKGRAPAFSFGSRPNEKCDSLGPGPGQYNVTGLSAKGKDTPVAISLYSRGKEPKHDKTPAPGDYNTEKSTSVLMDNSPKYTFGLKTQIDKPNPTPAPGAYNPEKSDVVLHDHAPKYTFGAKTNLEKPTVTPAPNVYNIPNALGGTVETHFKTAPAFTICGRQKDAIDGKLKTPGPGAYESGNTDCLKPKSPAFTVSSRTPIPCDHSPKPGPATYQPEKVHMEATPSHSFGIKHSPYSHNFAVY